MNWYMKVLSQYFDFSGRARRTEFWMFTLINFIVSIIVAVLDTVLGTTMGGAGTGIIGSLYSLAVLIPSVAVGVRRLHDIGKSGLWILLVFVPIIGWIWLLILNVREGDSGANQYGPNPKAGSAF